MLIPCTTAISLSIYSTSYTCFSVCSSSNPVFTSKNPLKIMPPTLPNHVNLQLLTLHAQPKPSNAHPMHISTHPTLASPSIPPLTLSSPPKSTQSHATNPTKPCTSTTTNPPYPTQTIQCSSHAPQLTSLSIYSTSYTCFSVCSSSNPFFISIFYQKSRHQLYQTMYIYNY